MASEHEIDALYVPICSVCGEPVEYNDDTQEWEHMEPWKDA